MQYFSKVRGVSVPPSLPFLSRLCLLVACTSRLRSNYSLRVSVTKLRDLSSNRQRRRRRRSASKNPADFRFAETKLVSREKRRGPSSSLLFLLRSAGCALMYGICIGPRECVRDRAWPYVTMRARSRAMRRVYSESFLFARARGKNMLTRATEVDMRKTK